MISAGPQRSTPLHTPSTTVLNDRLYAFNLLTGHDLPFPTRHNIVRVGVYPVTTTRFLPR